MIPTWNLIKVALYGPIMLAWAVLLAVYGADGPLTVVTYVAVTAGTGGAFGGLWLMRKRFGTPWPQEVIDARAALAAAVARMKPDQTYIHVDFGLHLTRRRRRLLGDQITAVADFDHHLLTGGIRPLGRVPAFRRVYTLTPWQEGAEVYVRTYTVEPAGTVVDDRPDGHICEGQAGYLRMRNLAGQIRDVTP
jgi:hypothetical protein